jgi:hypothetical protein
LFYNKTEQNIEVRELLKLYKKTRDSIIYIIVITRNNDITPDNPI